MSEYDIVAAADKIARGDIDIPPALVKLLDERSELAVGLYKLALEAHCPTGKPCDEDIECQNCTLLLIASEELGLPDPWEADDE